MISRWTTVWGRRRLEFLFPLNDMPMIRVGRNERDTDI